jgi:hypothetical protein
VSTEVVQEQQPFDVAWRTIDGEQLMVCSDAMGVHVTY